MNKKFVLTLSLLVVLTLAGCATLGIGNAQSEAGSQPTATIQAPNTIVSEGKVVPVEDTVLSFAAPGVIREVLVSEGQQVQAGQVLARLADTQGLQASLSAAQLEIQNDQLTLEEMTSPVAIANMQKAIAQDKQDIDDAQQAYDNQKYFTTNLDAVQNAKASLVLATKALDDAKTRYNSVSGDPNYNTNKAAAYQRLYNAQLSYNDAEYLYNLWTGVINSEQLDLKAANLAIAQAKLTEDQAYLEVLNGGAIPANASGSEIVGLQQARLAVQAAETKASAAQTGLDNLELKAPFAGTVNSLDLKVGMFVQPGLEVAKLADSSTWQVKTTDLTELDVVDIQPGMPATVTLDALPGVEMKAQVLSIQNYGDTYQGDIVYAVLLKLEQPDPRLRWNMTASVSFTKP